ncbi:MAG: FecR domain-containing protein [Pseudomonadota bacterium]
MADLPEHVVDEAIGWIVKLGSAEATDADLAACDRWRRARPEHDRAWRRLATIEHRFDQAAAMDGRGARLALQADLDSSKRQTLKLLLLAGAGIGLGVGATQTPAFRRMMADEATAPGERRRLRLSDRSHLLMNTDTALDLDLAAPGAEVTLRRGELYAEVADGPGATIMTRHGRFGARDASFALRDLGGLTRLMVAKGSVAASPRDRAADLAEVTAETGPMLFAPARFGPDPLAGVMDHLAWRRGRLVVEGMWLRDFAAELERYSAGFIRTRGEASGLTIAGVFPLDDIAAALAAVEATLPVRIRRIAGLWTDISAI